MEELAKELESIKVVLPEDPVGYAHFEMLQTFVSMVQLDSSYLVRTTKKKNVPESYQTNTKKEQLIISYADNFRRQFKQLYGDRKALFLTPSNEYDVEVNIQCNLFSFVFGSINTILYYIH